MNQLPLSGRVVIITGASSGIGHATALAFAEAGAQVVLASRNLAALEDLAQLIRARGGETLVIPTDVADRAQGEQIVHETLSHWGRIDVVVANAGVYVRGRVVDVEIADVERSLAVNFYGALYPILAALPHMIEKHSGHLVLVTSMDAKKGIPLDAPYVAAKFALSGFGEVMRQELHGTGVSVTTVFPGRVATPMIEKIKVPWISAPISAESVARAIVQSVHRRQPEIIIPPLGRLLIYLNTLSPRLGDWLVRVFRLQGEVI
ncbi:MAG: SDR family NAD(P)-dependent oxidoreductase [Caldilineaceae bacterium]|nr:SDR family NAD(P)-dependent oxidoreductase [Caldilineaceae bacterium]